MIMNTAFDWSTKKVGWYFTPRMSMLILGVKYDRTFSEKYARVQAFSHNPSDGSFAPLAYQPST